MCFRLAYIYRDVKKPGSKRNNKWELQTQVFFRDFGTSIWIDAIRAPRRLKLRHAIQHAQQAERISTAKKQMPVAADIPSYEGGLSHHEVHEDPRFPPELWNSDPTKGHWVGAGLGEREFVWTQEHNDAKQRSVKTPTPAARGILQTAASHQSASLDAVQEEADQESHATDAWLDRASSGVLSHEALDRQASEWVAKAGKFVEEEAHGHLTEQDMQEGQPQKARVGAVDISRRLTAMFSRPLGAF